MKSFSQFINESKTCQKGLIGQELVKKMADGIKIRAKQWSKGETSDQERLKMKNKLRTQDLEKLDY